MAHALNPLTSLNGGEYSPSMDSRVDLPGYRKACRRLRNMVPMKQGGVTRRPGTQFIAPGKAATNPVSEPSVSRMEPFDFAPGTTFSLEFGHRGIRFYTNGAQVQATGVPAWVSGTSYPWGAFVTHLGVTYYAFLTSVINSTVAPNIDITQWVPQTAYEVPTPYSAINFTAPNYWSADVFQLTTKQINDVVYIVCPGYPVWKLTRLSNTLWTMAQVQFLTPAMMDENATDETLTASATSGTGVTLTASAPDWVTSTYYAPGNAVRFPITTGPIYACASAHVAGTFTTDLANGLWKLVTTFVPTHVGSYWQLAYNRPASYVEYDLTANGTSSTLTLVGTWEVATYGTWSADISIQVSYDNGSTWQVSSTLTSRADANFSISGEELNGGIYRMVITDWTSETSTTPPRVVLTADNQFVYGLVQITGYTSQFVVTCTVIGTLYATSATVFWSEGAWSDYRGYPQAITVFQERVWYGFTNAQPQHMWGTQTDDLENFAIVDQSQASYGLSFDLNAPGRGPIQWLNAQTDLFVGLAGAEWVITSGGTGAGITATQILALEHSANGSAVSLAGQIVGNAVFYVQRRGRSFEQMLFSVFTNKYMSQDMQTLSQHLTQAGVKQFAYQQQFENQPIIWAVCGDGSLISMTYAMEQEVFAWAKHTTGDLSVNAGGFVTGTTYTINFVGTTDFTLIGAVANAVGLSFVATGPGSGSGSATTQVDVGFISVAVIPGASGADDEVWVSCYRAQPTDITSCTIERISPIDWQTANVGQPQLNLAVYADASVAVTSPGSATIGGLPAILAGRAVVAAITPASGLGTWSIRGLTANSSSQVTIPNYVPSTGDVVVIGLPVNWYVQPMRIDIDPQFGPTPGIYKSIQKLYLRLLNSIGGQWATAQGDVLDIEEYPITQNSGNPPPFVPNVPQDVELDVGGLLQYGLDPQFTIQGYDPLPMTILGIAIKQDIGGKP